MNSPTIPGQNNNGKNGAMVVKVPDNTGKKTSDAAKATASFTLKFLNLLNNR